MSASPLDLHAALTAKHAQHVVLVHFPIALSLASWLFDLLARWRRSPALAAAAYCNLVGAAISSLAAVATGLAAWQLQLGGARLKGNLRLHLVFAVTCSAMLWLLWWLRARERRTAQAPGGLYFALAALAAAMIALTGHLGGFLSGVNGG
jgi:uncharacterized membrane protein